MVSVLLVFSSTILKADNVFLSITNTIKINAKQPGTKTGQMFKSDVRIQMFFFIFSFLCFGDGTQRLVAQGRRSTIELHPRAQNFFTVLKEVVGLVAFPTS